MDTYIYIIIFMYLNINMLFDVASYLLGLIDQPCLNVCMYVDI